MANDDKVMKCFRLERQTATLLKSLAKKLDTSQAKVIKRAVAVYAGLAERSA